MEIINPNLKIIGEAVPASNSELKLFKEQIKKLEKLGCIRRSNSMHKSPSFFVYKNEVKADPRMVINYKRLNDNTFDNSYTLPHKDQIINQIQNAKWFSKFDCKSGYHQIKMHPDSIEWTAFICLNPIGHWEWNVMPFDLKCCSCFPGKNGSHIFRLHILCNCLY